jgi:hypothetical protein
VLIEVKLTGAPWTYSVLAAAALVDAYLLSVFFQRLKRPKMRSESPRMSLAERSS